MGRPDLSLLPIPEALERLTAWLAPQMPPKLIHPHEKISDAELVAVAVLQRVHKVLYLKGWWRLFKLNHCSHYPSEVQVRVRLERLTQ